MACIHCIIFSLFHCYVFYKRSTLDSHRIVNTDYWLVRRAVGVGCQAGVRRPSLAAGCHEGSLSGQQKPSFGLRVQVRVLFLVEGAGTGIV